ncbi:hypothetical protein [Kitasatospora sp. NPDC088783]|uniref:hypothetical protein n=1 Tax=Kitasatospora sp. NPDC088783 TaxID=3364077 RepID=UPI00381E6DA1
MARLDRPGDRFHLPGAPEVAFEVVRRRLMGDGMVELRTALLFADGSVDSVERQHLLPAAALVVPVVRRRSLSAACPGCGASVVVDDVDTAQPDHPTSALCPACAARTDPAVFARPYWLTRAGHLGALLLVDSPGDAWRALAHLRASRPLERWELWLHRPPQRLTLLATARGGACHTTAASARHSPDSS